jgi:hypothetical protein
MYRLQFTKSKSFLAGGNGVWSAVRSLRLSLEMKKSHVTTSMWIFLGAVLNCE